MSKKQNERNKIKIDVFCLTNRSFPLVIKIVLIEYFSHTDALTTKNLFTNSLSLINHFLPLEMAFSHLFCKDYVAVSNDCSTFISVYKSCYVITCTYTVLITVKRFYDATLTHKVPPIICSRRQFQILLLF